MEYVWVVIATDPDSGQYETYVFKEKSEVEISLNVTFEKITDKINRYTYDNFIQVVEREGERRELVSATKKMLRARATHL